MASVCVSAAEEEEQMWDPSEELDGDVWEDQSCFCSVSSLVTLVFLDFRTEGLLLFLILTEPSDDKEDGLLWALSWPEDGGQV